MDDKVFIKDLKITIYQSSSILFSPNYKNNRKDLKLLLKYIYRHLESVNIFLEKRIKKISPKIKEGISKELEEYLHYLNVFKYNRPVKNPTLLKYSIKRKKFTAFTITEDKEIGKFRVVRIIKTKEELVSWINTLEKRSVLDPTGEIKKEINRLKRGEKLTYSSKILI